MVTTTVSRDGDCAHREGSPFHSNPFPAGSPEAATWADDWAFRHAHATHGAPDAPGGRLRPADPVTPAEAEAELRTMMARLGAIADGLGGQRRALRYAAYAVRTAWANAYRDAMAFQPGERLRFYCGEGNDVLVNRGWRDVIFDGPIAHEPTLASVRDTWSDRPCGWVPYVQLGRIPEAGK